MPVTRRNLLIGGGAGAGLVLAWGLWPRTYRPNLVAAPGETILNAFLKIGTDGHVAVVVPQAEMGQGVWTALPQILADELGADWRTVSVEPAPISPLYANTLLIGEGAEESLPALLKGVGGWAARTYATRNALMLTGGSSSIRGFEPRFREAGAMARALLCMAAGARWEADWRACDTAEGFVTRGADRLRFADLAAEAAGFSPPDVAPLRAVGAGGIVGRSMPRLDLPAKVDGTARYAADVRVPDLVYASVRHGPIGSGAVQGFDRAAAEKVPGLIGLVEQPGWVAAVAANWWAADRAADAMAPRFTPGENVPDSASIEAALAGAMAKGEGRRFASTGDLEAAFAAGGNRLKVDYAVPFAVHAAIEPLTATARITGDRLELWMPTQAPGIARAAVAKAIGFAGDRVTVYPMLVGGGFGRKIEHDAGIQAALCAQAMKRPVQVTWSRAEETMMDRMRPPARARMTAALGRGGRIRGWQAEIAAPATMASMMGRLMPGAGGGNSAEAAAVEGAVPPYAVDALAVDHFPADIGVPTGIWRAVAHSYTAFFTECFVDELARLAGIEPLSFRIPLLAGNPRLAHCLVTATALGGWDGGVAGSGQGVACHSSFGSHVAMLAEAHVGEGQRIVVSRVVAVVDCGRIINPDIVRQQIEGGIMWGIAATLGATTGFTAGRADARNFDALGLPRLADTPEIRIELVRSNAAPGGVGEIAVPPVAPAIANALFAATGRRLRTLPLTPGGR
ncbi:xanthine dehydrogenase family protein molybdopterin-binding subunit [Sphingomonas solaris]|uniref:Xanthine dehydrogenase family protein molybdopterin-binding subunit n=1 Tax=Alterirhizorhabdus solaris TaxID=2529389 RepID=A0A558QTR7_9SPHN|nr:molybdopterin cofactor-binding domain-containing protein [Sphingomonas solaris]TVV70457.1 xanthine dehydrogenase family protein molybdopterin-binding subunit [Sphingomonas solaris]